MLWTFIAASLILFSSRQTNVVQRIVIAIAAAAIAGILVELLRPQSRVWAVKWSRAAMGIFLELCLPLALLWALDNQIQHATQRMEALRAANVRIAAVPEVSLPAQP
jgi:hypothetical protein